LVNDDPEALTRRARDLRDRISEAVVPPEEAPPPAPPTDDRSSP
jgi:hypothetical protein